MTPLNNRLSLELLSSKSNSNILTKGFTLVELMIVIVIVGVLSAVALPNFLSQTSKAKAVEAKSQMSAITKTASAEYQQGGTGQLQVLMGGQADAANVTDDDCVSLGAPASYTDQAPTKTKFDYSCTATLADNTLEVTATGNSADSSIKDKTIVQTIDLTTGTIELDSSKTCGTFGGTKIPPC